MTKTAQDFEMWQGEYKTIPISVVDGTGAPLDLTGASVTWVLIQRGSNGLIYATKTIGSGIAVVSAAGGTLLITLNPSDTAGLSGDTYAHELVVVDGSGHPEVGLTGQVHLKVSRVL